MNPSYKSMYTKINITKQISSEIYMTFIIHLSLAILLWLFLFYVLMNYAYLLILFIYFTRHFDITPRAKTAAPAITVPADRRRLSRCPDPEIVQMVLQLFYWCTGEFYTPDRLYNC